MRKRRSAGFAVREETSRLPVDHAGQQRFEIGVHRCAGHRRGFGGTRCRRGRTVGDRRLAARLAHRPVIDFAQAFGAAIGMKEDIAIGAGGVGEKLRGAGIGGRSCSRISLQARVRAQEMRGIKFAAADLAAQMASIAPWVERYIRPPSRQRSADPSSATGWLAAIGVIVGVVTAVGRDVDRLRHRTQAVFGAMLFHQPEPGLVHELEQAASRGGRGLRLGLELDSRIAVPSSNGNPSRFRRRLS